MGVCLSAPNNEPSSGSARKKSEESSKISLEEKKKDGRIILFLKDLLISYYPITSQITRTKFKLPNNLKYFILCEVGGKVYLSGGMEEPINVSSSFSITHSKGSDLNLSIKSSDGGSHKAQNSTDSVPSNKFIYLDEENEKFEERSEMIIGKYEHFMIGIVTKSIQIFTIGGDLSNDYMGPSNPTNICECYEFENEQWRRACRLNEKKFHVCACYLKPTMLYCFGGMLQNCEGSKKIESYNLSGLSEKWDIIEIQPSQFDLEEDSKISFCFVESIGKEIIIFGRKDNNDKKIFGFDIQKKNFVDYSIPDINENFLFDPWNILKTENSIYGLTDKPDVFKLETKNFTFNTYEDSKIFNFFRKMKEFTLLAEDRASFRSTFHIDQLSIMSSDLLISQKSLT